MRAVSLTTTALITVLYSVELSAAEPVPGAAEPGRHSLLSRELWPPVFPLSAYDDAWKQWGVKQKPANFDQRFRERYGLHARPDAVTDFPWACVLPAREMDAGLRWTV
jgi:hypothetical protein